MDTVVEFWLLEKAKRGGRRRRHRQSAANLLGMVVGGDGWRWPWGRSDE